MKCQFCRHPLTFSHHENNKEVEVYECRNCPMLIMQHFFHKDGTAVKTVFMLEKNNHAYLWTNDRLKGYSSITEISFTSAPGHNPTILKLPKLVEVTPDNVYQKFSFYMVFA